MYLFHRKQLPALINLSVELCKGTFAIKICDLQEGTDSTFDKRTLKS